MPVQILNETPLALGFVAGRVQKSGYHLTVIVKGNFTLSPEKLTVRTEPPLLEGDVAWDDDNPSSYRYASDFAPFKPRADVTVVGTCRVGAGQTSGRALFRIGDWRKTLLVHGDRQFIPRGGDRYDISAPLPFRSMPLRYERSFGGAGFASNPLGEGIGIGKGGERRLPNIELPSSPIRSPNDRPEPAGFGPLDRRWSPRTSKLGTYDEAWLRERWPYFPADFDWGYFNAAPLDQQLPYLRGDEPLILEGMVSDTPRFESRLPSIRPRCFLRARRDSKEVTEEVVLNLDTVSVDADERVASLVWRGLVPAGSREYDEVERALLVLESMPDAPLPAAHYLDPSQWEPRAPSQAELGAIEDAEARGAAAEMPEPTPLPKEPDPEEVAELDRARKDLESAGVDPSLLERLKGVTSAAAFSAILYANLPGANGDEPPRGASEGVRRGFEAPRPSASEPVSARAARRASDKNELDSMRADLRTANADPGLLERLERETTKRGFLGVLFGSLPAPSSDEEARQQDEVLAFVSRTEEAEEAAELADEAKPRRARGERLTRDEALAIAQNGGSLAGANLTELDLSGATLRGVDLANANITGTLLVKADLREADLTGATLRLADLRDADLSNAVLLDANLEAANLSGADLREACFVRADLTTAKLDRATLERADLTSAKLERTTFSGASIANALLNEADLRGALLQGVRASKASFRQAKLTDAKLDRASLDAAIFFECELSRTSFDSASLREAHFDGAHGAETSFRGADLANLRASGVRFVDGRFAKARAEKSNWVGAHLVGADFEAAVLTSANFTTANLARASFHLARLEEAMLAKAVLVEAKLTRANLFRARLGGADLTGADCRASNLFECDLFEANTKTTRFERANLVRTLLAGRSGA